MTIVEGSLQFNAELNLDMVWCEKKPDVQVIDTGTCYQNVAFIKEKTTEDLWQLFIEIWAPAYCGFPDILHIDREPAFKDQSFGRWLRARRL